MKICVTEKGLHSGQNLPLNLINYMKAVSVSHDFSGYFRKLGVVSVNERTLVPTMLSLKAKYVLHSGRLIISDHGRQAYAYFQRH